MNNASVDRTHARRLALLGALRLLVSFLTLAVVAGAFGATDTLDFLFIAMLLPEVLVHVTGQMLDYTLVPAFFLYRREIGSTRTWVKLWPVYTNLLILFAAATMTLLLVRGPLVRLIARDFDALEVYRTASLLIYAALAGFFQLVGVVAIRYCQLQKNSIGPAVWTAAQGAAVLCAVTLLAEPFGVKSILIGLIVFNAAQWFFLWKRAVRERQGSFLPTPAPSIDFFQDVAHAVAPIAMGVGAFWINFAVDRHIASWYRHGDVAILNFAFYPVYLLFLVLLEPISRLVVPNLSRRVESINTSSAMRQLQQGIRYALVISAPLAALAHFLGPELGTALYDHGKTDSTSASTAGELLSIMALGLPCMALAALGARTLISTRHLLSYSAIGVFAVAFNYSFANALFRQHNLALHGLAWSFAASQALLGLGSIAAVRVWVGPVFTFKLFSSVLRIAFATAALCAFFTFALPAVERYIRLPHTFMDLALQLTLGCVIYLLALLVMAENSMAELCAMMLSPQPEDDWEKRRSHPEMAE